MLLYWCKQSSVAPILDLKHFLQKVALSVSILLNDTYFLGGRHMYMYG